ncbi:copper type II ascorbate-dependent monooxygenase domain protein [Oesophagostomum dentatum]|uniref:Copper type II ascorbate-dependent monooxygenase domain protein n=1 Tax=Oesophagostomum dentatum TaxID=61180 RepID=A0A0B1TSZ0_OESDE|nr:copper type II ascorbate-dependent monooxygenase domain protein [Oesophagostomum dentatum]
MPIYFPPEAGLPLGGDGKNYIKVEIHYNNPGLLYDVFDNSGFEFVVTTELREHDAGIMEIGLIYSDANSIPPGQAAFPLTGHCIADCTNKLPPEGIHVFGSQLHAHLTGRKIFTSHYRNGVKIGEINRDNHYSPHWQHIVFIHPYVHVMPGDVLSTTCVYETISKNLITLGGYGIEDEMCVNYIYYYPVSEVEVCKSAIDNATLHNYFKHE